MEKIKVYHYDAFATEPGMGNPAGIVLGGDKLTEQQMQAVAKAVGFNESAFPVSSEKADLRIRFFSPGKEMELCGHATVATLYAMKTRGLLGDKEELTVETKAGILPVWIREDADGRTWITMRQAEPQFQPFEGDREKLAPVIGLSAEDLDSALPVLYGSTGTWTLIVPVTGLEACKRMKPDNQKFPQVLRQMPGASIHPMCLEVNDPMVQMHGRHFSSPTAGTVEDPVTGTASGVMGAYYARYIRKEWADDQEYLVEQGQEIGRDGRVKIRVYGQQDRPVVEMSGTAVFVKVFEVEYER